MSYFDPETDPDLVLCVDTALSFDPDTDPSIAHDLDVIFDFDRNDFDPDDPSVAHLLQFLESQDGEEE
jgi:hypothetical protein